jgi:3-mercaptopyruvate sulfurtransferase SseA
MTDIDWQARVKGLLKAELKRRNISYKDLAERLKPLGINETDRNIANKISRGGFTAAFMLQCLTAIGAKQIDISEP